MVNSTVSSGMQDILLNSVKLAAMVPFILLSVIF